MLRDLTCPIFCYCLTFAVTCIDIILKEIKPITSFNIIYLDRITFFANLIVFEQQQLIFQNSNISEICGMIMSQSHIRKLDFSFNLIIHMHKNCFASAKGLTILVLASNLITHLENCVFEGLHSLMLLNLTDNPIVTVKGKAFSELCSLRVLSLISMIPDFAPDTNVLTAESPELLEVSDMKMCCLVKSDTKCSAAVPWFFSCSDLLLSIEIKVVFYCVSLCIMYANLASIFAQRISNKKGPARSVASFLITVAINIVDLTLSLPLFIIWVADLVLQGNFGLKSGEWTKSVSCLVTWALFLNFNLLSPLVLLLLSVVRLQMVCNLSFKGSTFVRNRLAVIAVFCSFTSVCFTFLTWLVDLHLLNSNIALAICSPFLDPSNRLVVTKVVTGLTIIFQFVATGRILLIYTEMYRSLQRHRKLMKDMSVSKQRSNKPLIIQLVLVTSSNILCWIPCGVMYLMAMFLKKYPIQMLFWVTIAVNPLNSLTNPVVFIVSAVRKILNHYHKSQ